MCDDEIHQGLTPDVAVTRRTLGVSAAAAAALAEASAHAAAVEVAEKDVAVKTPTGPATPCCSRRPARAPTRAC